MPADGQTDGAEALVIERWTAEHERWVELLDVAAVTGQRRNLEFGAPWHLASRELVALPLTPGERPA